MAQCYRCGAYTDLYSKHLPICLKCVSEMDAKIKASKTEKPGKQRPGENGGSSEA
jgi:hypothetical protein